MAKYWPVRTGINGGKRINYFLNFIYNNICSSTFLKSAQTLISYLSIPGYSPCLILCVPVKQPLFVIVVSHSIYVHTCGDDHNREKKSENVGNFSAHLSDSAEGLWLFSLALCLSLLLYCAWATACACAYVFSPEFQITYIASACNIFRKPMLPARRADRARGRYITRCFVLYEYVLSHGTRQT